MIRECRCHSDRGKAARLSALLNYESNFSRRSFMKAAGLGLAGLAFRPFDGFSATLHTYLPGVYQPDRLGRVLEPQLEIKSRPDENSPTVGAYNVDEVVHGMGKLLGQTELLCPAVYRSEDLSTHPYPQPVRDQPTSPGSTSAARRDVGDYCALCRPADRQPSGSFSWLAYTAQPRLYYSQIMWVDGIQTMTAGKLYHVKERYGRLWR
jgi:hypothetical protein